MNAKAQLDKIVSDTIKNMLKLSQAADINAAATQAISSLNAVDIQSDDSADNAYVGECINKIAAAQLDIGLDERDRWLDELVASTESFTKAASRLDKETADHILNQLTAGGHAIDQVLTLTSNSIDVLKATIDQLKDGDHSVTADQLSEEINQVLEGLENLHS